MPLYFLLNLDDIIVRLLRYDLLSEVLPKLLHAPLLHVHSRNTSHLEGLVCHILNLIGSYVIDVIGLSTTGLCKNKPLLIILLSHRLLSR